MVVVTDLEAVCRCEAQRVITHLRGNRRFGNLSRSWRELDEASPVRQLFEWRCSGGGEQAAERLLAPLLGIVKNPALAGPPTCVALEAIHAIVTALCEEQPNQRQSLATTLMEVSSSVCDCVFEETNISTDEATTRQMIAVLSLCTTTLVGEEASSFTAAARIQAFEKVLALWEYYRLSPTIRSFAFATLQQMLDCTCKDLDSQADFACLVFGKLSDEVGPQLQSERALLHLRCLQRMTMHPRTRSCASQEGPHSRFFQDDIPVCLSRLGQHFSVSIPVLSLLLPLVNRVCWLCIDHWHEDNPRGADAVSLGALQVEALLSSVYLQAMSRAAAPLQAAEGALASLELTLEDGAELLAVLLEALCDLLHPGTVGSLWMSFDMDWRRPALLEQVVRRVVDLFKDSPSTERPLQAHVAHLCTTVLSRVLAAFAAEHSPRNASKEVEAAMAEAKSQMQKRGIVEKYMADLEEKPKKGLGLLKSSGLLDIIDQPVENGGTSGEFQEWAKKLAWLFRNVNYCVPYAATGEFFGLRDDDSEHAFAAFLDTFELGAHDMEQALRSLLQAFLIPKEAQQIDRILKVFADSYYQQQQNYAAATGCKKSAYLNSADAAHTFAFAVILLNSDQHNANLKRRMNQKDFIRNNRQTNDGSDFPEEIQTNIYNSIHKDEIKTPNSGNLTEGITAARWKDLMHLIRKGYRDNSLANSGLALYPHAPSFLDRLGEPIRTALESALAMDPGSYSDAIQGLEDLLCLAIDHQRQEADSVAEGLFFFGEEAFHELQNKGGPCRATLCLRVLFRTALPRFDRLSTRQLHLLVYMTVQFAMYGLFDRALPPPDPVITRLMRIPLLLVDPPTGVVYSFLRKISTAPFKMLSFAEDGEDRKATDKKVEDEDFASPTGAEVAAAAWPAELRAGQCASYSPEPSVDEATSPVSDASPVQEGGSTPSAAAAGALERMASAPSDGYPEASLLNDPLRPQIETAFEACELDAFMQALLESWESKDKETADEAQAHGVLQTALSYLSSLFLALRVPGAPKVAKDQDLPWWPTPPADVEMATPQPLLLPKRALPLNPWDGYEALRLAMRITMSTFGNNPESRTLPLWAAPAVQELCVCAHVGLFHTLRRTDLCERTLRMSILTLFQVAAVFLSFTSERGPVVSVGWPTRLIEVLVRRTDTEPQLLIPVSRLVMEAVRSFVTEASKWRPLDQLELWRSLLQLLLRAVPTCARALWPGARDREVEAVQAQVWRRGIAWLLGHPCLLDCLGAEINGTSGPERDQAAAGDARSAASFWPWALSELAALAEEMSAGNRLECTRLLVRAYSAMLANLTRAHAPEDYGHDDMAVWGSASNNTSKGASVVLTPLAAPTPRSSLDDGNPTFNLNAEGARKAENQFAVGLMDACRAPARAAAWSKVAVTLLACAGPLLGRSAGDEGDIRFVSLLRHTMLDGRVPTLLGAIAHGPLWARNVLEKLVTVLTGIVSSGAPLSVVHSAVSLVSKFFLQNLQALQRQPKHESFGQLWLMVLRLMLLFIKRGTDDRDTELEEIATETLKNLLGVLMSTGLLAYVTPRSTSSSADDLASQGEIPVWWQMTWDCIEVFMPGFGAEFSDALISDGLSPPSPPSVARQQTPNTPVKIPEAVAPQTSADSVAVPVAPSQLDKPADMPVEAQVETAAVTCVATHSVREVEAAASTTLPEGLAAETPVSNQPETAAEPLNSPPAVSAVGFPDAAEPLEMASEHPDSQLETATHQPTESPQAVSVEVPDRAESPGTAEETSVTDQPETAMKHAADCSQAVSAADVPDEAESPGTTPETPIADQQEIVADQPADSTPEVTAASVPDTLDAEESSRQVSNLIAKYNKPAPKSAPGKA